VSCGAALQLIYPSPQLHDDTLLLDYGCLLLGYDRQQGEPDVSSYLAPVQVGGAEGNSN
jgi:hypothetical protein